MSKSSISRNTSTSTSSVFPPLLHTPSIFLSWVPNYQHLGPLSLFQAVLPLLTTSPYPKFCLLGSAVGSIGGMENYPFPMASYGMSKAMAHYLVRKIHLEYGGENGKVVSWAVYPGCVLFSSFGFLGRKQ
jgi:hypothetical protein